MIFDLKVTESAHKLAVMVYKVTDKFPNGEIYSLTSQMRRAAISVPSNIVEGRARSSAKETNRFLEISRGSLEELKYQLFLSKDLEYIDETDYQKIILHANDVGKMLRGLETYTRSKQKAK